MPPSPRRAPVSAPARRPAGKPSPLDSHLGFWMRMVSNRVSGEFQRSVESLGISVSEWVALRALFDGSGTTHGALVQTMGMTKGAVSKVVRSLENKQLVARAPDAGDARSESLTLTASGRALVRKLAAAADSNDERFFGHLSARERAALKDTLERIACRHGMMGTPVD